MYTTYVVGASGGQKRALIPLELELQMLLSHQWLLGTEPRSAARAQSALNPNPFLQGACPVFCLSLPTANVVLPPGVAGTLIHIVSSGSLEPVLVIVNITEFFFFSPVI